MNDEIIEKVWAAFFVVIPSILFASLGNELTLQQESNKLFTTIIAGIGGLSGFFIFRLTKKATRIKLTFVLVLLAIVFAGITLIALIKDVL